MDIAQRFLWGRDWDNNGVLDPFSNIILPVADGMNGIKIRPPILNDFVDGDLNTPNGIMSEDRMSAYVKQICDEFIFDFFELFTDPGELIAEALPTNFRYLGFIPPPTGPSGKASSTIPARLRRSTSSPAALVTAPCT